MTYTPIRSRFAWAFCALTVACAERLPQPATPTAPQPAARTEPAPATHPRVIVMVWDGLRPDSITKEVTPRLAQLRDQLGVDFREHHSVYPTFTMMNAAALATGVASGTHGYYGNTLYQPGPTGVNAKQAPVDYSQPVYTED
ncbi:MAG TPA: alkaline phosphatase family protein, partial [Polyangiales bacterium]|nr:alkaline phosphatase family protein [Polyangiales bacterium]